MAVREAVKLGLDHEGTKGLNICQRLTKLLCLEACRGCLFTH